MKKMFIALAAVFAMGAAVFASDAMTDVMTLVQSDLYGNKTAIEEKSAELSSTEKLAIYQANESSATMPFALNLLVGYGLGSFIQKDYSTATTILVGDLSGAAVSVVGYALYTKAMVNYTTKATAAQEAGETYTSLPVSDPMFIGGAALLVAGSLVTSGFNIWGWFQPWKYSDNYNATLKEALGLTEPEQSASIVPVIDPFNEQFGLVAEIKF